MSRLCLILGDQLSPDAPSLLAIDPANDHVLMAEVPAEAGYVPHHPKKIALIFSAMRHYAQCLRQQGYRVHYHRIEDGEYDNLRQAVSESCQRLKITEIVVTHCGEWRLQQEIESWREAINTPVRVLADDRFISSLEEFARWAEGRKQLRMEFFYREMRKKTGLLMTADGQPEGGQWNYDHSNRKRWQGRPAAPVALRQPPDEITRQVLKVVEEYFAAHAGELRPFWFGVTREEAVQVLRHFMTAVLPNFGDFQDALSDEEDFLFHSLLSIYLNIGLLNPLEVCRAAESAWREGHAPLNAVEGFIRQIIGWREYVRGLYWLKMPDYAEGNYLKADQALPAMYWHGRTKMRCMAKAIGGSLKNAYAHHIQRLMVTGNFALLYGVAPAAICEWYLAIYADAYEWVELPNTLGMAIYGDGGIMASKPYAASGKYIQRMSDYCKSCSYNVAETSAADACPFNSLYWDFLDRHRDRLSNNARMKMMYRHLERMSPQRLTAIRERARWIRSHGDEL